MRKLHNFFVSLGIVGYITYFAIIIALLIGWFLNIGTLIGMRHTDDFTLEILLRIVGIFIGPLGGVMGWL